MPNFCSVVMMVEAEHTDKGVEQYTEFVKVFNGLSASQGFFNAYVPIPERFRNDNSLLPLDTWLRSNWSARNDVPKSDIIVEETGFGHSVIFRFDTEWNPPENFIINLGGKYDAVKFAIAFSEAGFNQAGVLSVEHGNVTDIESINVELAEDGTPTGKYGEFLKQYGLYTGG